MLVDRFSGLVYSIAKRYHLSSEDASDVFQSTFQALHAGLDRIDQPEGLPNWLAVTASRIALRISRIKSTVPLETPDRGLTEVLATEEKNAEEEAIRACESTLIREAVQDLGGRCGPLLSMLYLQDDVSYQAASEATGIPVGAIGPTRTRCLDKLRKALEKVGFFE
jgi:RNA polymerase sigma factor (sigma-70 family)